MWKKYYSKTYIGVKKEEIWKIWADINNWSKWHKDLDYCKIEGEFKVGNHFLLKPKNSIPVKIMLTEIEDYYKFTDCTSFFGAKMYDTHIVEETDEGLKITNILIVTGPLKWLWIKLVADKVAHTIPNDIEALVELARERND